jgi:flagellar biosynthesis protein FlhA
MSTTIPPAKPKGRALSQVGIPLMIVSIIVMLVVPLPTVIIDLLLAGNLTVAVLILITAMLIKDSLEFSVFPALLLVTTLARLAINVSSTRSILLNGYAGHVIEGFGNVVIGGNLIVGLVVFLILVVIQFAVVTSGAGRVAEVAARFTLDAMPGKQMAIDADLNAGLIDEAQAKERRAQIAKEADLAGAMDGASKFVKGDAIAGIIIVLINLIGGFAIGMFQNGLSFGEAIHRYSLLSVGDGLVSAIPSLLISVASAFVVTRIDGSHGTGIGGELASQLGRSPRALRIAAVMAAVFSFIPGMPMLPFLALAGALFFAAFRRANADKEAAQADLEPAAEPDLGDPNTSEVLLEQVQVDPLRLELAPDLLDLLDTSRPGGLVEKVRALRQQIAKNLGLIVPAVRTSDSSTLPPSTYAIKVNGVEVARGEAPAGCSLVLLDSNTKHINGRQTKDPVFGIPGVWVASKTAQAYALSGSTVIERSSVIVTHLSETVKTHAADLITRKDVQTLLDAVRQISPGVADEVDGKALTVQEVQEVLRQLLEEGVPIRNLTRIIEAISTRAASNRRMDSLVEAARLSVAPMICETSAQHGVLNALSMEPRLAQNLLSRSREVDGVPVIAMDAATADALFVATQEAVTSAEHAGHQPVIVVPNPLRSQIRRLIAAGRPDLRVLSYAELSPTMPVNPVGEISIEQPANV